MSYKGELLEMTGPGRAACCGYPAFVHFQDRAFSTLWGAATNISFSFFVLIYHLSLSAAGHGRDMLMASAVR